MNIFQSASKFLKNIKTGILDYFKLTPRLTKLIGLEIFVFGAFIGICVVISEGVMRIPNSPDTGLNFLFALLKVGISLLLVGLWLISWYLITKRLMKDDNKEIKEKEEDN
jgi:hypothetical protein